MIPFQIVALAILIPPRRYGTNTILDLRIAPVRVTVNETCGVEEFFFRYEGRIRIGLSDAVRIVEVFRTASTHKK